MVLLVEDRGKERLVSFPALFKNGLGRAHFDGDSRGLDKDKSPIVPQIRKLAYRPSLAGHRPGVTQYPVK